MNHLSRLPSDTQVTIGKGSNQVKTNLGDLMKLTGIVAAAPQQKSRRIVKAPASPENLAKMIGALKPAETPSVTVSAKKPVDHSPVTIYISKETIPGDDSKQEYLCLARTRRQDSGEIIPDNKMNFGFDKSFSYHQGEKLGQKWPSKQQQREVGGVRGKFWVRYVPQEAVATLLQGLRENFAGATLQIDGQSTIL